jgi:hypothetical protein
MYEEAATGLALYARTCGWTLARANAGSGIVDFSGRYADQNERDYEAFTQAIRSRKLTAVEGL